jgi:hypothetical protein
MEMNCTLDDSRPRRLNREMIDYMLDDSISMPSLDLIDIDEDDDGSDHALVVFPMPDIHLESTDKKAFDELVSAI